MWTFQQAIGRPSTLCDGKSAILGPVRAAALQCETKCASVTGRSKRRQCEKKMRAQPYGYVVGLASVAAARHAHLAHTLFTLGTIYKQALWPDFVSLPHWLSAPQKVHISLVVTNSGALLRRETTRHRRSRRHG